MCRIRSHSPGFHKIIRNHFPESLIPLCIPAVKKFPILRFKKLPAYSSPFRIWEFGSLNSVRRKNNIIRTVFVTMTIMFCTGYGLIIKVPIHLHHIIPFLWNRFYISLGNKLVIRHQYSTPAELQIFRKRPGRRKTVPAFKSAVLNFLTDIHIYLFICRNS